MSLQLREGGFDGLVSTQDLSAGGTYATAQSLTTTQGICVKLDASNQGAFIPVTAITDDVIGQITDQPQAGQVGTIRLQNASGKNYVQLGGTVAIGSKLGLTTNGRAVALTQASAGAQPVNTLLGVAVEAGTVGAIIEFYPAGIGEKY
jgi:hypothetical protein